MEENSIRIQENIDLKEFRLKISGIVTATTFFWGENDAVPTREGGNICGVKVPWGIVQHIVDSLEGHSITVDMTEAVWVDAMALMYLVHEIINASKKNTIFFIPLCAKGSLEKARFHFFLMEMGFFSCVAKIVNKEVDALFDKNQVEGFKRRIQESTYGICPTILPMRILRSDNEISDVLEKIGLVLEQQSGNYIKSNTDMIMAQVSPVIQESVGNVFEHAYEHEEGVCCIYVRYLRYGSIINKKIKKHNMLQDINQRREVAFSLDNNDIRENVWFPNYVNNVLLAKETYADVDEWEEHRDIIQIFVTDLGMGIAKSFGYDHAGDDRGIIDGIFSEGKRSKKKLKNTKVGGLSMIKHLLEKDAGFISVKGDYSWVRYIGGQHNANYSYITRNGIMEDNPSKGTAFVFAIKVQDGPSDRLYQGIDNALSEMPKKVQKREFMRKIYGSEYRNLYEKMLNNSYNGLNFDGYDCRYDCNKNVYSKNYQNESIILLRENTRKNKIIESIREADKQNASTLIIGDVNENEWKKYHFILNSIGFISNIKKIIVITDYFHCGVYSKKAKARGFYYDERKSKEYVNVSGHSAPIGKYLFSYIMWLKWNDSRALWKITNEHNYYVSGNIYWSEDVILNEYLDFFRLSMDTTAKFIIKKQMGRLAALYGNICYVPADRLMHDLCAELNRHLPNSGHKNAERAVGSVFVTGYSIEDTDPLSSIYLFKNPLAHKEVYALCDWRDDYDFECNQDGKKYYRVGSTPFISIDGDDYFRKLHYYGHKNIYCASQSSVYDIVQTYAVQYRAMSCIGHVNMIDRHDMIHIDWPDVYFGERNWHYSVKEDNNEVNLWDFLLCELTCSIASDPGAGVFCVESDVLEKKFVDKVETYSNSQGRERKDGIVIYSTDYQTKVIVESIRTVYNPEYAEKIIPISPIVRNRSAASLLTSPMYLDFLRDEIKRRSVKNGCGIPVTVFFAEAISTRKQREIEHIMYSLGAAEVKMLSLADRTRLSLGVPRENRSRAFCRIDLPSARNNNLCLMCRGRKVIESTSKQLNSELLNSYARRINSAFDPFSSNEWNPGHSIYTKEIVLPEKISRGIKEICDVYNANDHEMSNINVTTDFGLVLFSIESTVISMSSNFLLQCIDNEDLDCDTKILLLCSHLYHFSRVELSKRIYEYCIRSLWDKCLEKGVANKNDNYLALGIIVLAGLISDNEELFSELMDKAITDELAESTIGLYFYLLLVIVYNSSNHKLTSRELEGRLYKSKDTLLNAMYGVVLHTQYDQSHLHSNISNRIYTGAAIPINKMDNVLLELEFLENQYKSIPEKYFRGMNSEVELVKGLLAEEKLMIQNMETWRKEKFKENNKKTYGNDPYVDTGIERQVKEFNDTIKAKTISILDTAIKINKKCFIGAAKDWQSFRGRLQQIANQVILESKQWPTSLERICVVVNSPTAENDHRLFYYNIDVETEISYLMMDFRHASEFDMYDKSSGVEAGPYDGIVAVNYHDEFVEITFTNYIDNSRDMDHIRDIKHNKVYRPSHLIFEQLNAKLPNNTVNPLYSKENLDDKKVFVAAIRLPYVDL
jgi:hypothetical protein